jgi:hypothetical protein
MLQDAAKLGGEPAASPLLLAFHPLHERIQLK